jgi:predicted 3-demethylubiquinone-9 3-methyltransferase (glyoxalase superfamily)
MQKITPFLWFDHEAEEAAAFYVDVFTRRRAAHGGEGESKILGVARYGDAGPGTPGTAMTVSFLLEGQEFTALNGGPAHNFTEALSFFVGCETQAEVDQLWDALLADGGHEDACGWLKDRYGLSWQIVPTALPRLLSDPDPERARRVMEAMLQMKRIDVAELERAARAA